jgi:SHS2 domain-containing protein
VKGRPVPHPRYLPIDHTADLGLQVWGKTLPELYANAAEGMASLYYNPGAVRPLETRAIAVEGYDREEVLVHWLSELLYLVEVHSFLPSRFEITELDDTHLRAEVSGELFSRERHEWRTGIKAVTYHDIHVQEVGGEWMVTVIFDT